MKRISLMAVAVVCAVLPLTLSANNVGIFDETAEVRSPFGIKEIAKTNIFFAAISGHEADTLVLSCMDFRLIGAIAKYMAKIGKAGKYDHVILAGASLGVNNTKYPEWGLEFWEHVTLSRDLHNIKNVMIIDHRNCGAYREFLHEEFPEKETKAQRSDETASHKKQLDQLSTAIHAKYPFLGIQTRLMALDGSVEVIGDVKGVGAFPERPKANH